MMCDHGGGQTSLKKIAAEMNKEWSPKGIHIYYIPDLYYKEKDQMREYLTQHKMRLDQHAGVDDTSEVMYIDRDHKWIRKDKLAPDDGKMGVNGDPTQATPDLGKMFIDYKINDAIAQIRSLIAAGK
jgi:creatinine amidohydrolase/Fe(II)-dependent formamide hydrolase-like protein